MTESQVTAILGTYCLQYAVTEFYRI